MKIEKLDFSVAILAGLACFAMIPNIPVWALFIGWAWYFALGGTSTAFKQSIPALILGYVLAAVAVVVYAASGLNLVVLVITVAITVFIIMMSLKLDLFACSLASFNAYSCMFAGYYAGNFPKIEAGGTLDVKNVIIAACWIALANIIGLGFGWLSVTLGAIGSNKKVNEN